MPTTGAVTVTDADRNAADDYLRSIGLRDPRERLALIIAQARAGVEEGRTLGYAGGYDDGQEEMRERAAEVANMDRLPFGLYEGTVNRCSEGTRKRIAASIRALPTTPSPSPDDAKEPG